MRAITPITRRDLLLLIIIMLIAGWMRLGRGDIVEYFHDDAMLSTLALAMVDGESFPLTGILSSTGIPNPPTSVYVMVIPFSLSSDPNVAILFVMILNVLGVGLLWLVAHRYFGRRVGIVSGLIYAISPWAVLFSRKIWAQDFHTPFILLGIFLLLYGFWETSNHRQWKHQLAQILSIPILLFAFQIHFAAWAIAPIILIIIWIGRKQTSWLALAISVMLSVVVLTPYAIGLSQTLDQDPTRISDAIGRSGSSDDVSFTSDSILYTGFLSSGIGLETWVAPDQETDLVDTYPPFYQLGWLLTVFMLLGVFATWQTHRRFFLLLVTWAFLTQFVLIPAWTQVYVHYFNPVIPALMLFIGIGFDYLLNQVPHRILQGILWSLLFVILGLQMVVWHHTLDYLERQHVPYPGFTTPIRNLNAIQEVLKDSDDVLVISQGMAWNLHHEVAVWDTLLWDEVHCVRTMVGEGYAVFPSQPFDVLIAPDAPKRPVNNLYRTNQPLVFDTRQGGHGYILYRWDTVPEWNGATILSIDAMLFDNGVQLTGYALENDFVYLEWQLPAQQKGVDYQYSAQLFDNDGTRVSQLDKTFWHGRHWCERDRLITWGVLPTGDGATTLTVSLYQLGTGKDVGKFFNANVLDELGNPAGQQVDILIPD